MNFRCKILSFLLTTQATIMPKFPSALLPVNGLFEDRTSNHPPRESSLQIRLEPCKKRHNGMVMLTPGFHSSRELPSERSVLLDHQKGID